MRWAASQYDLGVGSAGKHKGLQRIGGNRLVHDFNTSRFGSPVRLWLAVGRQDASRALAMLGM